jgi:signal transduction histidine kinase
VPHKKVCASAIANAGATEERARIARELHDGVSQTLYAIALAASRALRLMQRTHDDEVQDVVSKVLQLANSGQCELRALLTNIYPDSTAAQGLCAGLTKLAAAARTRADIDIHLSLTDEPDLPAAAREALILIAREALHNVIRHAAARHVEIVLEVDAAIVTLLIADDGQGFYPRLPRPGHFGLESMRERAAAVGAALELSSSVGAGTQVWVRVRVP